MSTTEVLIDGLGFPEGLCWDGAELWFSDFASRRVYSLDTVGRPTERAYVPGQPSGIGFLPDGTPLVISMMDHLLVRLGAGHARIEADVSSQCTGPANDMIVDARGRTYFGAFGYDPTYEGAEALKPSAISMLSPGGEPRAVADSLMFPNGMAITADGGTLVVAETFGSRLTAFSIAEDGSLRDRRTFADLGELAPDGICVDAEGAVWAGCPFAERFVRVADGGEILQTIETPGRWAITCALGGPDRNTLFCATAKTTLEEFHHGRSSGAIEIAEVEIPSPDGVLA